MYDKFFLKLASEPVENLKYADVKEIGMELDWFSHVYGRTMLVGTLMYESYKNYRCKTEFNKRVLGNPLNIPTVIFIHDWTTGSHTYNTTLEKFGSFDNLFNNQDISEYKNVFIFNIKPPKLKSNGKSEKHFNVQRKKRFRVPVINGMSTDNRVISSTVISCTFRDLK
jgi:hypothetical protein